MQGGLGVIQHGFRVLFVVVFGFALFFILKSFVEILNTLLCFYFSLYNFTFSPPPLDVLGPLVPLLLGQQVGVAEGGQHLVLVFPEAVFQHVITGVVCH